MKLLVLLLLFLITYVLSYSNIKTLSFIRKSIIFTSKPLSINEKEMKSTSLLLKTLITLSIISPTSSLSLGIDKSGLLNPCITDKECLSSQDDRPFCFLPPWSYNGNFERAKEKLINAIMKIKNTKLLSDDDRYIRVEFNDSSGIDEVEFYFTPNDYTIQFRAYRKVDNNLNQLRFLSNDSNRNRLEKLRLQLGFEEIEVLRNRRRLFIFGESPFDTFGPPSSIFEENIDNISGDMISNSYNIQSSDSSNYPLWEIRIV